MTTNTISINDLTSRRGLYSPYKVASWAVPSGIAPSGTMADNGAVTLGTALLLTYSGGIWLYFPANAIQAGSAAGLYWTVMSSTTVGTVYNNTLNGATEVPYYVSSPTAFVTTGPGAFTGVETEVQLGTVTIPANTMGPNGQVVVLTGWEYTNSASTKTPRVRFGGTSGTEYLTDGLTTTQTYQHYLSIRNRGVTNKQVGHSTQVNTSFNHATSTAAVSTVDTTADVLVVISGQKVAADQMVLEFADVSVTYGA